MSVEECTDDSSQTQWRGFWFLKVSLLSFLEAVIAKEGNNNGTTTTEEVHMLYFIPLPLAFTIWAVLTPKTVKRPRSTSRVRRSMRFEWIELEKKKKKRRIYFVINIYGLFCKIRFFFIYLSWLIVMFVIHLYN